VLDVSVSYNRYKFLGHEFLTWLWFAIENDQTGLEKTPQEGTTLHIGNRLVLDVEKRLQTEAHLPVGFVIMADVPQNESQKTVTF